MTFGARARIRLGAIRQNLQTIRSRAPGSRVMAVIKANAYGHGLLPVARALAEADCLAVARLAEARLLRDAGIDTPIAVLGGVLAPEEYDEVVSLNLHICVHDQQQIRWLEARAGKVPVVWLKVDTGMHRLGINTAEAAEALGRLQRRTDDLRLMTHFASADNTDDPMTSEQLEKFRALASDFDGHISVANSPGLLGWGDELVDTLALRQSWIRPGLALYGISPFGSSCGADLGLRPSMRLEATLMSVKQVSQGARVGYGGTWQAERDTTLGVVAAGYGDGYTRYIPSGTPLLVNGRRVPVAGSVSMDLTTVDLGPDSNDGVGDPVVLWGDTLPVEEIARYADTIPYLLVTGVMHREQPVYEEA